MTCLNFDHEPVYSTHREDWICPFCEDKPRVSWVHRYLQDNEFELTDYQQEILEDDGHRVLVGGRQIGKSTTAYLEAGMRSHEGRVVTRLEDHWNMEKFLRVNNSQSIAVNAAKSLVVDWDTEMRANQLLHYPDVKRRYKNSLIVGTPDSKGVFKEIVKTYPNDNVYRVSMPDCPFIPDRRIQEFMEMRSMNRSQEIYGRF